MVAKRTEIVDELRLKRRGLLVVPTTTSLAANRASIWPSLQATASKDRQCVDYMYATFQKFAIKCLANDEVNKLQWTLLASGGV